MNKFGHCCSYTVIEEQETEATFASTSSTQICPADITKAPNLQTGVAFDNFDRFVDTLTGKDTLHDTVGIIFQNINIANAEAPIVMWVGFNSLIHGDHSPQQRVSYLTTINSSPTDKSVVYKTMVLSQQIGKECQEYYMQVTYDLAIAREALRIQAKERPQFNNLFIHLGTFHVMMAYFKAIGKFIDNCGLSNVMVDCGLLASGSVNAFITGKHFNRCKRLHPMVALGLRILHFEQFLEVNKLQISSEAQDYLQSFKEIRSLSPFIAHDELDELFKKYEEYTEKTMFGEHGVTAQYYLIYNKLIDYYLLLNSSIRTANLELFMYVLPKMSNLFFAFNQPNYARWLVKYHDNLLKIDETHPGLKIALEKGSLGVKRTPKPFSRQPIDLTLEQTINADTANKLTGIVNNTNSISARQRWCKSHSIRSTIISHVLQLTGLNKSQDNAADLEPSRIKKSTVQLRQFIDGIKKYINPFTIDTKNELLYNISNGEAVSDDIRECLINVEKIGSALRQSFISECVVDEKRFETPIKRNKMFTFTDSMKKKLQLLEKYKKYECREICSVDCLVYLLNNK